MVGGREFRVVEQVKHVTILEERLLNGALLYSIHVAPIGESLENSTTIPCRNESEAYDKADEIAGFET